MQTAQEVNKDKLVEVRNYREGDRNFILSTWLRGLYYGNSWFNAIPKQIFMEKYHIVLELILRNEHVKIKVAALKDDPEVILGYAVFYGDSILHWIHVKKAWRNIGIGRSLVPNLGYTTHLTKLGIDLLQKKFPNAVFDPWLV